MARAPNWTEQEFEVLLQNPRLSDQEVAAKLERRTVGAVGVVREGLHNYHTGKHYESILSKMMKRRLEEEPAVVCPRCGEKMA